MSVNRFTWSAVSADVHACYPPGDLYWVVLELLAQPGPFDGAWTAATMATRLTWRVTQVQRGLTWVVANGWATRVPRTGKQPQLYRIAPAGLARLRQPH